jgi:hypothetical protein
MGGKKLRAKRVDERKIASLLAAIKLEVEVLFL